MKLTEERHDENGGEKLDPRPMQPPLGYKRAPSLAEQIREQVLAAKLEELDHLQESLEEADDFDVEDDFVPSSEHENDHIPTIAQLKIRAEEINIEIQRQQTEKLREELIAKHNKMRGGEAPATTLPSPEPPSEQVQK